VRRTPNGESGSVFDLPERLEVGRKRSQFPDETVDNFFVVYYNGENER
jgi:hypothetical protein